MARAACARAPGRPGTSLRPIRRSFRGSRGQVGDCRLRPVRHRADLLCSRERTAGFFRSRRHSAYRRSLRDRPRSDLRLPLLPCDPDTAHGLPRHNPATARARRRSEVHRGPGRAALEAGVCRAALGQHGRAQGGVSETRARSGRPRGGGEPRGLLLERRHGQLDGRGHGQPRHRPAGEDVLDRLRCRRATTRWSTRASLRGTSAPIITSTTSRRTISSSASRGRRVATTSRSATRRRCRRISAPSSRSDAGVDADARRRRRRRALRRQLALCERQAVHRLRACSRPREALADRAARARPAAASVPLLRKGARYVEIARTPLPGRMQLYNLLTRMGPASVFTPEFLRRHRPRRAAPARAATFAATPDGATLNRTLAYEWKYILADNDLPKVTGTASLGGVDVGFPLLDDRLLDFSLGLPPGAEAARAQAPLLLQGGAARISARRDHRQEEARLRAAVRRLAQSVTKPSASSHERRSPRSASEESSASHFWRI